MSHLERYVQDYVKLDSNKNEDGGRPETLPKPELKETILDAIEDPSNRIRKIALQLKVSRKNNLESSAKKTYVDISHKKGPGSNGSECSPKNILQMVNSNDITQ